MIPAFAGSRVGHIVDAETGCWNWTGAKVNGYGRIGIPGTHRTAIAHRFYFERVHGPVPKGKDLDHLCRNRGCVNPAHLEVVTRTVNAHRGAKCKLTAEQAAEIRERYKAGGVTMTALANEYGVHNSHISRVVNRRRGMWA